MEDYKWQVLLSQALVLAVRLKCIVNMDQNDGSAIHVMRLLVVGKINQIKTHVVIAVHQGMIKSLKKERINA